MRSMPALVTSFRMYNAGPRAASAWRALFERVFAELSLDIEWIEHGWPDPIDSLWKRPDLCCAFMCGWPFVRAATGADAEHAPLPIAVPVPSPPRYEGLPRYCSEFLVRERSGWTTLAETFGHRFGWMADDSQSGFNAPRAHLAGLLDAKRTTLFSEVRGPLGTPMRTLDALRAGEVDVVALDGYFLDLCRLHQPEKLAGIRTVENTAWTPMPLLVAAAKTEPSVVAALRDRLLSLHESADFAPLLREVLLQRFVEPDVKSYGVLQTMATEAIRRRYELIR
jgi:ABC-type phosphate/phosphonate transport system substrate-binding protein